jgi:hypothetical protein
MVRFSAVTKPVTYYFRPAQVEVDCVIMLPKVVLLLLFVSYGIGFGGQLVLKHLAVECVV